MVAKIFIDGEAGTTGLQIRERLAGRRDLEVLSIAADKRKDQDERKRLLNAADIAILCLPDDAARESVSLIENGTTRVIDASTAFRVHPDWAYGFAEMDKGQSDKIANARFVANPGCWPQGLIANIRPLIAAGLIPSDYALSYNGISGYTGGGKQMIAEYEAEGEAASQFMPYGLTFQHKHVPEMTALYRHQGRTALRAQCRRFRPGHDHLRAAATGPAGQACRPVASCMPPSPTISPPSRTASSMVAPYEETAKTPALDPQAHNDTNTMTLHVFANDARAQAVLVAVYDNLGKGASGAAVQNLNLMLGVSARESLAA